MYCKNRYLILTFLLAVLSIMPTTIYANEPMPVQTGDDSQLIARGGYWGGGRGYWRGGDGYYGRGGRGWVRGGGYDGWRGGGNYYYTSPRSGYGYGYGYSNYSNYGGYGGGGYGGYGGYRGGDNYCSTCGGFGFGF